MIKDLVTKKIVYICTRNKAKSVRYLLRFGCMLVSTTFLYYLFIN
jgi:hypothetical protein